MISSLKMNIFALKFSKIVTCKHLNTGDTVIQMAFSHFLFMSYTILKYFSGIFFITIAFSSCILLRENSKYEFNDGIYTTKQFSRNKVYVLHVDDDTIAVFPVLQFKDSTAIQVKKRVNYCSLQKKFKDNKVNHTFYKPSFDADIITIPLKFRPSVGEIPNQLITTFNGAFFGGYRIDEYKINYKRTPLNIYKQYTKHFGYSFGMFLGLGNSLINPWVLNDSSINFEYEGVALTTGVAASVASDKLTFGVSFGFDYLLDRYRQLWIYQGRPCIGFTLGLDLY